jgi:hypothetical protein
LDYSVTEQTLDAAQQRWFSIFTQPHSTQPTPQDHVLKNTNLAANEAVGYTMPTLKPDNTSRFYFINPNGFQLNATGGTFAELCAEVKRISVNYIAASLSINLMAINLESRKSATRQQSTNLATTA